MPGDLRTSPYRSADAAPFAARHWHLVVAVITALAVGSTAFVKLFDPDVWWHIRVGEWVWHHRGLPHADPFSWTADLPYGWHPVLAELALFAAETMGGAETYARAKAHIARLAADRDIQAPAI